MPFHSPPARRKRGDKRREKRVSAALPIDLGRANGVTRDVSASGVFFETSRSYSVGSAIHFALDLDTPWGRAHFECSGRIVRLERRDGTVGVAVHLMDTEPPSGKAKRARARLKRAAHARRRTSRAAGN